jgi:hypothetical protein
MAGERTRHGETTVEMNDFLEVRSNAVEADEISLMWLLIMVLLNVVPELERVTILNTFATTEECQTKRNCIGFAIAEAHPYERDFAIACRLNPTHSSYGRMNGAKEREWHRTSDSEK